MTRPPKTLLAAAVAVVALSLCSSAGATHLDRSFGGRGFVEAPGSPEWIGTAPSPGKRLANYPGGRLLVGGRSRLGFAVYRYRRDGRLDPSFGEGGVAIVTLPGEGGGGEGGSFGSVSAIAVQPDGKILIAGLYTPYPVDNCEECEPEYADPRESAAIVRLDPDGGLDVNFGGSRDGKRHLGMKLLNYQSVNDLAVRDGRIYIAGEHVEGDNEFGEGGYVGRLRLDGRYDKRFGKGGEALLPPSNWRSDDSSSSVGAIRFDRAGRVYAGGYDHGRMMLVRLTRRGTVDRGFARHGYARLGPRTCHCAWAQGLARDRHGRLLISGAKRSGRRWNMAVARYLPGGRLDRSFGGDGVVVVRLRGPSYGAGVTVQPNGRVVVVGSTEGRKAGSDVFVVARLLPDGRRDHGFFGDGVYRGRFGKHSDRAMQPLIDGAGRLLVAGETYVARFTGGRGR